MQTDVSIVSFVVLNSNKSTYYSRHRLIWCVSIFLNLVDDNEPVGALLCLGMLKGTRLDASRQSLADTEAKHFAT